LKKLLFTTIFVLFSISSAFASTLHYSDWENPFSPTYTTVFGNPTTVAQPGVLSGNSLAFNTSGNWSLFYYDQISYNTGSLSTPYNVSFDIHIDSLIGTNNWFSVLFDTPTVRPLRFTGEGNIAIWTFGSPTQVIGSYKENQNMHVDMMFDIGNNEWDISIDGSDLYSGYIDNPAITVHNPASQLETIRFNHGLYNSTLTPDHSTTVYLDNVSISNVPIPASIILLGTSMLLGIGIKQRKKLLADS
jgi:hypothetical protein